MKTIEQASGKQGAVQLFTPVIITVCLLIWTAWWHMLYPQGSYGSWQIYPALISFPAAVIWHGSIIYRFHNKKKEALLAAAIHLVIMFTIWTACLMSISGDSL